MATKIFIAGHNGMVGSAISRNLATHDAEVITVSRDECDLINQTEVDHLFAVNKFDQVYLAAAKVGGIYANNKYPANFLYDNLMIEANIINAAHKNDVQKLLFLGSSCIYPKYASQPMSESSLMTGTLEQTNEPYAIAKIAGIKLCESYNRQFERDYRSIMPTNLYGPGDNYHPKNSHVIPALIRRFHEAKIHNLSSVTAWGTGKARREFLYVDDMASAAIHIMDLPNNVYNAATNPMSSHINIGTGLDVSIKELTEKIAEVTGYKGKILWDHQKPDGTPRKLLDVSLISKLGWKFNTSLSDGLEKTYSEFKKCI